MPFWGFFFVYNAYIYIIYIVHLHVIYQDNFFKRHVQNYGDYFITNDIYFITFNMISYEFINMHDMSKFDQHIIFNLNLSISTQLLQIST